MRAAIVLAAGLALSGCNAAVEGCEDAILASLRAPSTYDRVDASSVPQPNAALPHYLVSVKYDAQNGFGAMIRSTTYCEVPMVDGKPVPEQAKITA